MGGVTDMMGLGWGGMLLWPLAWVAVLALVVGVLAWLFQARPSQESPLETLKRRYARGELTQEEYEQARRVLA